MNKKDIRLLQEIEMSLSDGINFIMSERTQVATKFGDNFVSINKHIGSQLCQIYNAKRDLRKLIESKLNKDGSL